MDRRHTKLPARLAMLSVLALVAGACSNNSSSSSAAASGGAPAAASLSVELDWVPNPDHVGLYYAQDKGYFTDSNLTVDFRTPSNTADPIKLVALNKVDLAITYEPEMFYGQESELPAIAVATVVPVPLNSLIMNPSEPITDLSELAGKSVGVTGIPSDDAFYQTMLKTAGLTESDVTKVNVGFNLVPSVLSGKVDGIIGGYQNVEAIQIEQESGTKPVGLPRGQARRSFLRGAGRCRQRRPSAVRRGLRRLGEALRRSHDQGDRRSHRRPVRCDRDHEDGHRLQADVPG